MEWLTILIAIIEIILLILKLVKRIIEVIKTENRKDAMFYHLIQLDATCYKMIHFWKPQKRRLIS